MFPTISKNSFNSSISSQNYSHNEHMADLINLKTFLATAGSDISLMDSSNHIKSFKLPKTEETISCVLWDGVLHISGTDILKIVTWRFEQFGRQVINQKKFEEGIFSDLRNLKNGMHARLEGPRSVFLEILFKNRAIRTQKKQKVFYFYSVPHDSLFIEALERDFKREASQVDATTACVSSAHIQTLEHAKSLCSTIPGTFPTMDFKALPTYLNYIINWTTSFPVNTDGNTNAILEQISPQLPLLTRESPNILNGSPSLQNAVLMDFPNIDSLFCNQKQPNRKKNEVFKCLNQGCSRTFQSMKSLNNHTKKHTDNVLNSPFSPTTKYSQQKRAISNAKTNIIGSPYTREFGEDIKILNQQLEFESQSTYGSPLVGLTSLMHSMEFKSPAMETLELFESDVSNLYSENRSMDIEQLFRINQPTTMSEIQYEMSSENPKSPLFKEFLDFGTLF